MWTHGHFYWNELNTRDVDAAMAFYGALFGWTFETSQMQDGSDYTIARLGETMICGIYSIAAPAYDGMPDNWFAYVAVADVDRCVAGVGKAGGTVVRPAFDVPEVGRIAIVKDPTGVDIRLMTPAPMA